MDIRNTIMDIHNCVMDKYEFITRTLIMGDNLLPWPWCRHILSIIVEMLGHLKNHPSWLNGLYELQEHVQKHELLTTSKNDIYFQPRQYFNKT